MSTRSTAHIMKALRLFIGLLVMATMLACNSAKETDKLTGIIIVANKSGNDVHFIDRGTEDTLAVLSTGLEPHEVEVSDDGKIAIVCNYGDRENPGNTLSVYDVEKLELIKTINLGMHTRPHGMKWMKGTSKMLVTTEGSKHLLIVDIEKGEIVEELFTDQEVSHMVGVTPDLKKAFVPSIRTGNVTVFDLETKELIAQIYSGAGAEGIDVSPDGKELWVTNRGENTIAIFDTETLELIDKIPSADFPIRAKFSPDGKLFLVSNARSGTIAVIDVKERTLIKDIKLITPSQHSGDERYFSDFEDTSIPIGLVVPDNKTAYVASTRADVVAVICLETFEITGFLNAGKEPDGISFSKYSF
jgi:YVTN family beta-propeller protein